MTKDNLLSASIGVLLGFIAGYMLHEMIVARQPPRLTPEMRAQIVASPDSAGGAPMQEAPPQAAAGGPASAEVQELQARLQQNPDDTEAILRLANLNFDIGNWSRAQELYARFLELKPVGTAHHRERRHLESRVHANPLNGNHRSSRWPIFSFLVRR